MAYDSNHRPCDSLKEELKFCLLRSECFLEDNKSLKDCLKLGSHPSVPSDCQSLRYQYFLCRRELIDMRTRFRGRRFQDK